jgi:hypothetical protein
MAAWVDTGTGATEPSPTTAARDQVVQAARAFTESVHPHLYHLVDEPTRTQLLRPLVHAATTARQHLGGH